MAGEEQRPDPAAVQGAQQTDLSDGQGTGGAPKPPVDTGVNKPEVVVDDAAAKAAAEAAAKKTDAPKPAEEVKPEPESVSVDALQPVGDPAADAAIGLMNKAKLSQDDATAIFGKAIETGNTQDIDTATLIAKVGPEQASAILGLLGTFHATVTSHRDAIAKQAYEAAGGQENWQVVQSWSKELETKDAAWAAEIAQYRPLIDAGGPAAKLALDAIVAKYKSNPDTKGLSNKLVTVTGAAAVEGSTAGPLGRAEFSKLISEAHAQLKPDQNYIASLRARRKAGMAAGMQ
jgi:hypothetical protein